MLLQLLSALFLLVGYVQAGIKPAIREPEMLNHNYFIQNGKRFVELTWIDTSFAETRWEIWQCQGRGCGNLMIYKTSIPTTTSWGQGDIVKVKLQVPPKIELGFTVRACPKVGACGLQSRVIG